MCVICQGTSLEGLVQIFCCEDVRIESFQQPLPESLDLFDCNCSKVTSLPKLPDSLRVLYCYSCPLLRSLPEPLPRSLQILYCYKCPRLASLPPMPESLQMLDCHSCRFLISMPTSVKLTPQVYSKGCPWILRNPGEYYYNLKMLKILQRFCKNRYYYRKVLPKRYALKFFPREIRDIILSF